MANKTMDSAREFETQAKELLERVKRMQNDLGAALQSVKRAESELIDKEKRAEKERMEKERAERLREVLTSEGDLAFHVGDDRAEEQPAPAESKSEVNEKPKPEPVKEQKAEESVQAKAEEPAMADRKPEEKPETKAKPAPANKPVQQQRPAYERREPQRREDGRQQKPRTDRPQRPAAPATFDTCTPFRPNTKKAGPDNLSGPAFCCVFVCAYFFSPCRTAWAQMAAKVSSLMSCSILQASSSATLGSTPRVMRKRVRVWCRSSILAAMAMPESVRVMSPSRSMVMYPFSRRRLVA